MKVKNLFRKPVYPIRLYNSNGKHIYYEDSNGSWVKWEYDSNGNRIYLENSNRFWEKREYDSNGNRIYSKNSNGYWAKREYDSNGNQIYYEDSYGAIINNRRKTETILTMDEIAKKFNIPISQLKIKKQ